ncbi:MAG: nickel pincer cofactor biosynthesis protein LarB [Endomicrobium sp.]|jgi:NCAIR mutase (PurE)-related protein|nr:nickel pincer cofactor biosynthesis protein LarB [Endomicrobium sp.]
MNKAEVLNLLNQVKKSKISPQEALSLIKAPHIEDLGYAKIDYHRQLRQGVCEIIFGENKTYQQLKNIISSMVSKNFKNIIITRISLQTAKFLKFFFDLTYSPQARIAIVAKTKKTKKVGNIVIASGGTSDIPICEEAAITAETLGNKVYRLYDVGVAGIHRLLSNQKILQNARVIIAVAGMEGALPSVIGGIVDCPIIAVPTSIGYGANFNGLSALLCMLNSCSSGISVVNIDNGFGAGYIANRINKMESIK